MRLKSKEMKTPQIKLSKFNHAIYTTKLQTSDNMVLFDIRPNRDYLKRYVLMYRILHPERLIKNGANLLTCHEQNKQIFNSRKEARMYIYDNIINYF